MSSLTFAFVLSHILDSISLLGSGFLSGKKKWSPAEK